MVVSEDHEPRIQGIHYIWKKKISCILSLVIPMHGNDLEGLPFMPSLGKCDHMLFNYILSVMR